MNEQQNMQNTSTTQIGEGKLLETQSRWRSPVAWGAIIGQLLAIALAMNIIPPALGEQANNIAAMVLQLLVLIGVLNNPTNQDGF